MVIYVKNEYCVAVVGATGLVGQEMIRAIHKLGFPFSSIKALASKKSAGKILTVDNQNYLVEELTEDSFNDVDIAFFSAGSLVSRTFVPFALQANCKVIDNTSFFRMDKDIPLICMGVNEEEIPNNKGIIANPNCSTIQMMIALKPLHERYHIKRIIVSTYQAVSGAGFGALDELHQEINNASYEAKVLPSIKGKKHFPIAYNVLAQIDEFDHQSGYSFEELKMVNETHKILDPTIDVIATCVRVPVSRGHSESVTIECEEEIDTNEVKEILKNSPYVVLQDDTQEQLFPQPLNLDGENLVYVGRIRQGLVDKKMLSCFIVADNLVVGAAGNAVQIGLRMHQEGLL